MYDFFRSHYFIEQNFLKGLKLVGKLTWYRLLHRVITSYEILSCLGIAFDAVSESIEIGIICRKLN